MKFGGTSVEDVPAFERVTDIVTRQASARPVVVVSAMSRFTDALLEAFDTASAGRHTEAAQSLEEHFARHVEVAHALIPTDDAATLEAHVASARRELAAALKEVAESARPLSLLQDLVVSYGEQLS